MARQLKQATSKRNDLTWTQTLCMTQFSISARVTSNLEKRKIANVSGGEVGCCCTRGKSENDRENKIFTMFFRCYVQLDYTPVKFNAIHSAQLFHLQEYGSRNIQEKCYSFTILGSGSLH
jgi:hypothetical protein